MHIQKSTMSFLKDLSNNNNKPWFDKHKDSFEKAKEDFKAFALAVEEALNKHDLIEKTKIFRIYRDVRFSKDKTPYKSSMSVGYTRATAARRGGYYFAISPQEIFVGGGFWGPEPNDLRRIRDEFLYDAKPMRKLISDLNFVKHFGALQGEAVKTAPKGFDKNHDNIDLIRMKQFLVAKTFDVKDIHTNDFHLKVDEAFQAMRPFFDYFSSILTTNINGESIL